jgi:hypothetical protein
MDMTEHLEQTANNLEERVRPQLKVATQRLALLNKEVSSYIRTNPGKCLLGAIAAGYVIGRIARRR